MGEGALAQRVLGFPGLAGRPDGLLQFAKSVEVVALVHVVTCIVLVGMQTTLKRFHANDSMIAEANGAESVTMGAPAAQRVGGQNSSSGVRASSVL
ncbi:hypothetical protein GCM10009083_22630 [Halopseudomonas pertucinogena]|uniref:Uncharacterized protein n=1 Tax=Halopseudomonas pertucinogena TaxID=86175 RepID=A0ABQ2CSP4_9GAMM|nr:hypothetical protein GCM10009083_22630 [Halopseudomonas pertucinogena]